MCDPPATVDHTIIAFNMGGEPIEGGGGTYNEAILTCCGIYGNEGGDWVGEIADQFGTNGNISEDPLFCDPEMDNFYLQEDSPCGPFTPPNEECDRIGAWPVGCEPTATITTSWGGIKALFR
jgi:hypothetical protein